jgi:hypothetical protein
MVCFCFWSTNNKLTTGITFSLHGGNGSRSSDDKIKKTDPQKKLVHGTAFQKSVVGIDSLGDALERVHFTWDTDEVGGDETNNSDHSSASVTKFAFTEPRHEWAVSFRKLQLSKN